MRLPLRAGLLLAVLTLLVPSSASADTTVPAGSSIQAAVDDQPAGSTITVQGAHTEDVTVGKQLTIVGVDGASLTGTLTATAAGVVVRTLSIASASATPVATSGSGGLTLAGLAVQRTGGSGPAIDAGGAGLALTDVIGVNTAGPAVAQSAGEAVIQRVTLATTDAGSDAVRLTAGASKLTADSSYLVGGGSAAGLRVANQTTGLTAPGPVAVALRHATVTGGQGVVLDATKTITQQSGSIDATVTSSIVHDPSSAKGAPAVLLVPAVPVTLAFDHSDTPGVADADRNDQATVSNTAGQYTADTARLFGKNLHLRVDSTAIDKGAAPADGESATDVDGQPRVAGGASDIGADEFVNSPPKAAITLSKADPQQNEPVTFSSAATDPDAGDTLTQYYWDFGDRTPPVATDQPSVSHAYANTGTFTVKMAVKDKSGAFSDVATAAVTVKDGAPPVVKITTPRDKGKLRLNPKAKKAKKGHKKPKQPKPLPLTVLGTVSDGTGVQTIQIAITYRKTAKSKSCKQYTGKKLAKAGCTKFRWVKARINGSGWQLVTKKGLRLVPGRYELRARGTDTLGNVGGPIFSAPGGSLVRVTVK
jgi:PKD repeat protein